MKRASLLTVISALLASSACARSARADGGLAVAALAGYASEDRGFGAGLRAGFTLPFPSLYLGVRGLGHLGASVDTPAGESVKTTTLLGGAELGYDFTLGPITLRPQLGAGFARLSSTISAPGASDATQSENDEYVAPGAVGLFRIPLTHVIVGAEVDYTKILVDGAKAYAGYYAVAGAVF